MADDASIIGKVAVKVWPDTREFQRDLKRDLERIERATKILVNVEVDTSKAAAQVEVLAEEVERKLEKASKIDLEFDQSSYAEVRRAIDQVDAELDKLKDRVTVEVDLDEDSLRRARRELEARLDGTTTTLKINEDLDGWKKARDEVDRMLREREQIDLTVEMDEESLRHTRDALDDLVKKREAEIQAEAETTRAALELARVARERHAIIVVEVQKAALARAEATLAALSGGRLLQSTFDKFKNFFSNLDKNIPIIGGIAEAVAGLSAWLLAAASNTFALSRSLAQIAGIGLLLPGMFAGAAIGLGSAFAVLKDIDTILPEIKASFIGLQDRMSVTFWNRATDDIRAAFASLWPDIEGGFLDVSSALGGYFSSLASSLANAFNGHLAPMFRNLSDSISIASGGTDKWAGALEKLGTHGSKYLPRLARWTNDLGERFNDWLTEAERTGRLDEIFGAAIYNAKQLGRAVSGLGSILTGLGKAAEQAGGSTLAIFADTLHEVADAVNSDGFQRGLIDALTGAHVAMRVIATESGPAVEELFSNLASTLSSVLPVVGQAIGSLVGGLSTSLGSVGAQRGIAALFDGLRDGIQALEPMWGPLGDAIGAVATIVGDLARDFGPLLAEALALAGDVITRLTPGVLQLADTLSGLLTRALDDLGPLISAVASAIGYLAGAIGNTPATIGVLVGAFVALRAAVASEALATGLATLAKFLGREIAPAKIAGIANGIGAVAGKLGLVGAAVGGAFLLFDWATGLSVHEPDATKMASAMEHLAAATSELQANKLKGMVDEQFTGGGLFGTSVAQINGFTDALSVLRYYEELDKSPDGWAWLNPGKTTLWGVEKLFPDSWHSDLEQAKTSFAAFDQQLAAMVNGGNLDGARANVEAFGLSAEEVASLLPNYSDALDIAGIAAEQAAEAERLHAEAVEEGMAAYQRAVDSVNGITPTMIGTINDGSKSFIDFGAAMEAGTSKGSISLAKFSSTLAQQITDAANWSVNLVTIAQTAGEGVATELANLGPSGAKYVGELAKGIESGSAETAKALDTIAEAVKFKAEGAATLASSPFRDVAAAVSVAMGSVPDAIEEGFGDAHAAGLYAGQMAAQGFANGLTSLSGQVRAAANSVADIATRNMRVRLGVHSPSRVWREIGQWTSKGFALGVIDKSSDVMKAADKVADGVTDRLKSAVSGLNDQIGDLREAGPSAKTKALQKQSDDLERQIAKLQLKVEQATDGSKNEKRLRDEASLLSAKKRLIDLDLRASKDADAAKVESQRKTLQAQIDSLQAYEDAVEKVQAKYADRLEPLESQWDDLASQIGDATRALEAAKKAYADYAATVSKSITGEGNIVSLWDGLGELGVKAQTMGRLNEAMRETVDTAKKFRSDLESLAKRGVDQDLVEQLVNAGMGSSADVARMLSAATDAELAELNGLWGQLEKQGDAAGASLAKRYMQSGVDAASGFLKGLESKQDALEKQMRKLADAMVNEIKTQLGIHSPSKVFESLAGFTVDGWVRGVDRSLGAVRGSSAAMAMAAQSHIGSLPSGVDAGSGAAPSRQFNYYAAPGTGLSSEEELFAAVGRSRMVGW